MQPAEPADALSVLNDPTKSHLQVSGKGPYGSGVSSVNSSDTSLHVVKNVPGYSTPVFKGKQAQQEKVQADVASKVGFFFAARYLLSTSWAGVVEVEDERDKSEDK